jgi:uncharacterized protein VirK/YbjX
MKMNKDTHVTASSVTFLCHGMLPKLMLLLVWQRVGVKADIDTPC